jgi:hypothetical protein
MLHALTRRGFLARTLAGVGALSLSLPLRGTLAARRRLPVFVLDPNGGKHCGSCSSCRACQSHGANKLFASRVAADTHRAHPNCNCAIREAGELPTALWFSLFGLTHGDPKTDGVVDLRHAGVLDLLGEHVVDLA